MTRDEAVNISKQHGWDSTGALVDTLVALGVLKLEPQSADDRLWLELGWTKGGRLHTELCRAFQRAGLKLVEK